MAQTEKGMHVANVATFFASASTNGKKGAIDAAAQRSRFFDALSDLAKKEAPKSEKWTAPLASSSLSSLEEYAEENAPATFQDVAEYIADQFSKSDPNAKPIELPSGETLNPQSALDALAQQYVTGDAGEAMGANEIQAPAADPALVALRKIWSNFVDSLPDSPVGSVTLPNTDNIAAALNSEAPANISKALDGAIDAALKLIAKDPAASAKLSPGLQEEIAAYVSGKTEIDVSTLSAKLVTADSEEQGATDASLAERLSDVLQKFRLLYDIMASGALEGNEAVTASLKASAKNAASFLRVTSTDISVRVTYEGGMKNLAAALNESDAKNGASGVFASANLGDPSGGDALAGTPTSDGESATDSGGNGNGEGGDRAAKAFSELTKDAPEGTNAKTDATTPSGSTSHWSAFTLRQDMRTGGGDGATSQASYTQNGSFARQAENVLAQIKIAMQGHNGGNMTGNIRLQLQPAELGLVNIRMQKTADGKHHIYVAAERPETAALLQQEEGNLRGMLKEIISSDSSSDFSFHFFHQDDSPQRKKGEFGEMIGDTIENEAENTAQPPPQQYVIDGLVNIQA
ncbi:MAG: flagellar hook-length control protein FliK [Rickettsiales bacterium]